MRTLEGVEQVRNRLRGVSVPGQALGKRRMRGMHPSRTLV
jgi:hypothetical protein